MRFRTTTRQVDGTRRGWSLSPELDNIFQGFLFCELEEMGEDCRGGESILDAPGVDEAIDLYLGDSVGKQELVFIH